MKTKKKWRWKETFEAIMVGDCESLLAELDVDFC